MVIIVRALGPSAARQCVRCLHRASQSLSDGSFNDRRSSLMNCTNCDWCYSSSHYVPVCHRSSGHFVETSAPWEPIDASLYESVPRVPATTVRNYVNFDFPEVDTYDETLHW